MKTLSPLAGPPSSVWQIFTSVPNVQRAAPAPWTKPLCVSMQLQLPRCPTLMHDLAWWRGLGAADCGHHTGVLCGCQERSADSHLMDKLSRTKAFLLRRIIVFTGFCQTSTRRWGTRPDTPSVPQPTPPALLGLFHSASEKKKSDSCRRVLHVRHCCSLTTEKLLDHLW